MSENKANFRDANPENQKPHNISGKNPRSVQNLHKAQVKPKSQDKEIKIEIIENEKNAYKTKTSYLVQKAKMQLKRRVAPGISEIIIRKNEEKRKKEEAKAAAAAQAKAKEEAEKEAELKEKVEKEIEKQKQKIETRAAPQEDNETVEEVVEKPEPEEEKVNIAEKIKEDAKEVVSQVKEKVEAKIEENSNEKSFTQTLREQGLIQAQKISEKIEETKPKVEQAVKETKEKIETKIEETKTTSDGKSFTQTLREQGLIQAQKISEKMKKQNQK